MYKIVLTDVDGPHWLRDVDDWDEYRYLWTRDENDAGTFDSREAKIITALMELNPMILSCIKVKA